MSQKLEENQINHFADFYLLPLSAGDVVTIFFDKGTSTDTKVYLLGGPAARVQINADTGADASITKINGRVLRTSMSIPTDATNEAPGGWKSRNLEISTVEIACTTDVTVKIYAER